MSRTLSGNLTGRAAVTDAREFREMLQPAADVPDVFYQVKRLMGIIPYVSWLNTTPDDDEGMLRAHEAKLAEFPEHGVELASSIDVDPGAEAREAEGIMATFGGELVAHPFSHEDFMSEGDIANEMRGAL